MKEEVDPSITPGLEDAVNTSLQSVYSIQAAAGRGQSAASGNDDALWQLDWIAECHHGPISQP